MQMLEVSTALIPNYQRRAELGSNIKEHRAPDEDNLKEYNSDQRVSCKTTKEVLPT